MLKKYIYLAWTFFENFFAALAPINDLVIRAWVAKAFFFSGLSKLKSWHATVVLFHLEYQVPFCTPSVAATLAIIIEVGLGGRLPAFILFVFNILAVISYPFLLTTEGAQGLKDHIFWGMLLMMLLTHGTGKLSLDYLYVKYIKSRSLSTH
jgi:putative oxidoreductase